MKKQKRKHGYYREQKEAAKAAKTGISIEAVYEEYLRVHETLPKSWNKKHWKYEKDVKLKQAQQVAFALPVDVKYEHVKMTKKEMQRAVRDIVIREHKLEGPRRYAGDQKKIDLTKDRLNELRRKNIIDDNTYKRFYRRLVEADPERQKLEYDSWAKEFNDILRKNFDSEARYSAITEIFFGSDPRDKKR